MKLTALRLYNVRRFAGRGIAIENIGEGVNVLSAGNEFGKSTCFDALHALFFQPHTSNASPLKALRPYSGGSPVIEADIATGRGAYRLAKQFFGGGRASVRELVSGRLIAQADEAEAFISGLVHGGSAGPAGLLWVRQGVTGLEARSRNDEAGEKRARESVLTSVQGEVEQLTGGRRMALAMARCEAELSQLVTATARPKVGGPYHAAIEAHERLSAEERRLAGEVKALRDALDTRRLLRERLGELEAPDAVRARQRQIEQAEAALQLVHARGAALATAEAEYAQASTLYDAAHQAEERRRARAAQLETLRARRDATFLRRDEAQQRASEAGALVELAARAVDAVEREEREVDALLSRVEAGVRAGIARQQKLVLQRHAAEAEKARADIEKIEARLKTQSLTREQFKPLEEQENTLFGLKAARDAQSPALTARYLGRPERLVELDGLPLEEGISHAVTKNAAVTLAGAVELIITLPASGAAQASLAAAEARHAAALKALGVGSLAEARAREAITQDLGTELALARQSQALHAPNGLAALREEIARLEAQIAAAASGEACELKADPQALRIKLDAARAEIIAARAQADAARAKLERAGGAHLEIERNLAMLTGQIDALDLELGPIEQRKAEQEALAAALRERSAALQAQEAKLARLRAQGVDIAAAQARLKRLRLVQEGAGTEITRLREEIARLGGKIQTRAEEAIEEAWQACRDACGQAAARLSGLEHEIAVLTRLKQALESARLAAREHYFAPVVAELRPLLGLLFEDASVTFDEETLLPSTVTRQGLEEPVDVLSGGMREQLAILTRLAFARLLAREGEPAPVILDDALVYSDDDRIERMFDALHRQASDQQIIVFSCRQRAFAQLGGKVLGMVPWQPAA